MKWTVFVGGTTNSTIYATTGGLTYTFIGVAIALGGILLPMTLNISASVQSATPQPAVVFC